MKYYDSIEKVRINKSWLSIGSFDGVHRGHQAVLLPMITQAKESGIQSAVLIFHPHPAFVLGRRTNPLYLTTPEERVQLLNELGVDIVIIQPFDRSFSLKSPREFIQEVSRHLGIQQLWIGYDFAFGRNRRGDHKLLESLGKELDFEVLVKEAKTISDQVISSSRIREALFSGNIVLANEYLGRYYSIPGKVIPGDGRGRQIGYPTANIEYLQERAIPAIGVYACMVLVDAVPHKAVTNIGVRPTFDPQSKVIHIETHIIDYNRDLYEETITIKFIERIRDEKQFSSVNKLTKQIKFDIEEAKRILS